MTPGRHLMACESEMQRIVREGKGDPESAHAEADRILCKALSVLGFRNLVAEYKKIEKWYA